MDRSRSPPRHNVAVRERERAERKILQAQAALALAADRVVVAQRAVATAEAAEEEARRVTMAGLARRRFGPFT